MTVRDVRQVDPAEAEEAAAVVCLRVADVVIPDESDQSPWAVYARMVTARSSTQPCAACGEEVMVDSISPKRPPKVCLECAATLFGEAGPDAN